MNPTPDLLFTSLKMLAALVLVLAGIYLSFRLSRKWLAGQSGNARHDLIRILASSYVGVKKTITMVEVPGSVLVLGITPERITVLTTIEDSQTLEHIRAEKPAGNGASFSDQLQRWTSKFKSES